MNPSPNNDRHVDVPTHDLSNESFGNHGIYSARDRKLQVLMEMQQEIEKIVESHGLDCFPQHFEVVDYQQLKIIVAQGGFPKKYLHMRTGLEYEKYDKQYSHGLAKVYELVINNDPCVGYLLDSNSLQEQRMVMAHVYGHNDFFKNNVFFRSTDRKMLDTMGEHASRIQYLMEREGVDAVEEFIDVCTSIDDLIDPLTIVSGQRAAFRPTFYNREKEVEQPPRARRFDSPAPYMDDFINPSDWLQRKDAELRAQYEREKNLDARFPERDVMLYLLENAPLTASEYEVLSMVRDQAYYFAPQRLTKIMNEGWASFWHNKIMTEAALHSNNSELIEYAITNAKILHQPEGGLNPYRIGLKIFEDILRRWDRGQFGLEWEQCEDRRTRESWNKNLGLGLQKIFEVRAAHNDATFIREFLTPELVEQERLFEYKEQDDSYEVTSRKFQAVKDSLIQNLVNGGRPVIEVINGNYDNAKQLLLRHQHDGRDLDIDKAEAVLENIFKIWKRPVHIVTVRDEDKVLLSYDGVLHDEIEVTKDLLEKFHAR